MLNIQPQSFTVGFPGVTNRFEWFAIDCRGRIMLPQAGTYLFRLTSDDGSRLHIDGREVIDNDGVHGPDWKEAEVTLAAGIHDVRVQYFQGPREDVALVLEWGTRAEDLRPLDFGALAPAVYRREGNRLRAEMSGGVLFATNSAELPAAGRVPAGGDQADDDRSASRRPHFRGGPHGRRGIGHGQPGALRAARALRGELAHEQRRARGGHPGHGPRRGASQGPQHQRPQPRPEPAHRDHRHAS